MDGYWQQPDATDAAIVDGWFHTGDGGSLDEFNYVTISDRKKDVIISGGENVSSIEVEDAIFQHPDVTEVAVIGVPDEKWGELVTALVVKTPGQRPVGRRRDRVDQEAAGGIQVPEAGRVPRRAGPHGNRQAAEVQAARRRSGKATTARCTEPFCRLRGAGSGRFQTTEPGFQSKRTPEAATVSSKIRCRSSVSHG